jgi:hypothetical protein
VIHTKLCIIFVKSIFVLVAKIDIVHGCRGLGFRFDSVSIIRSPAMVAKLIEHLTTDFIGEG